MIQKQPGENFQSDETIPSQIASDETVRELHEHATPSLSIFAIPKKFEGHIDLIQTNAIHSWASMHPNVEIFLFGDATDDRRLGQVARETNAIVMPVRCNDQGTPIISDAFRQMQSAGRSTTYCYANCDMIFETDLLSVVHRLETESTTPFLATGRRIDHDVQSIVDFDNAKAVQSLFLEAAQAGEPASIVCKDFFLFSPEGYAEIPEFVVGRGNWDNWMVAESKKRGIPVVDVSSQLTAIHQNHDYSHAVGGRRSIYVTGTEAKQNQRLAGGRRLVSGSTANWELSDDGLIKRRFPTWQIAKDTPKFMRLLRNLLFLGYILPAAAFPF